jgi:TolB protein
MGLRPTVKTVLNVVVTLAVWCFQAGYAGGPASSAPSVGTAERHFKNVRQLTFGRKNAEAYFSFDGSKLIFQSTNNWMKDSFAATLKPAEEGLGCYQMYVMDLESKSIRLVSTGTGATTCGYFFPGDRRVLYSSTFQAGPNCAATHLNAGLRCRGDGFARRKNDCLDLGQGRRSRSVRHEPGRDETTPSDGGSRIRWRSVFFA